MLAPRGGSVRLAFDTTLEDAFLRVRARGGDGRPLPVAVRRDPRDPQAVEVRVAGGGRPARVEWRVLSADGHVGRGARGPGGAAGAPAAAGVLAALGRLALIAGLVAALGLVVLRAAVVGPAWAVGGIARPGRPADAEGFRERAAAALAGVRGGWWAAWWIGTATAGGGAIAVVLGTLAGLGSADVVTLVADTRLGHALAVTLVALAAGGVAAAVVRRAPADAQPPLAPARAVALGAGPAVGLVALSWAGHASSGGDATLNVLLDAVHNAATAAWLGGLVGLLALLHPAGRALAGADRVRLTAAAVVRFSALGVLAVATLAVTGVYRALAELDGLGDLTGTRYGVALLVKLGLFGLMLVVAGYNRLLLHPRLERAALGLEEGDRGAADALGRSVRAELALAAALLVAVAVLVSTAPPGV